MTPALLTVNAGSSSLKFQVFGFEGLVRLAKGQVSHIGMGQHCTPELCVGLTGGPDIPSFHLAAGATHEDAVAAIIAFVETHLKDREMTAVAHRIVHGGSAFDRPVRVTPDVIAQLKALIPLAPLHQPHNVAALEIIDKKLSHVPQIACFDTAFHFHHDARFQEFAIEAGLRDKGVRRYGFHGLSYEWIAEVLKRDHPDWHGARIVAAHLGNGASLCAMQDGLSIDTTMGLTALDGLPMGSRVGAIDAGAVLYMMQGLGMKADAVEDALYNRSGLRGLSGISNDMAELLASPEPRARFAIEYFALKAAQYVAMMAVSLGGIDGIVFTGGIGENAEPVRRMILERLTFMGALKSLVIPANEERMMAMHARTLLQQAVA